MTELTATRLLSATIIVRRQPDPSRAVDEQLFEFENQLRAALPELHEIQVEEVDYQT